MSSVEELEQELADMTAELEALKTENEALNAQIEVLEVANIELHASLTAAETLNSEHINLTQANTTAQTVLDRAIQTMNATIADLEANVDVFPDGLKEKEKESVKESRQEDIEELKAKVEKYKLYLKA